MKCTPVFGDRQIRRTDWQWTEIGKTWGFAAHLWLIMVDTMKHGMTDVFCTCQIQGEYLQISSCPLYCPNDAWNCSIFRSFNASAGPLLCKLFQLEFLRFRHIFQVNVQVIACKIGSPLNWKMSWILEPSCRASRLIPVVYHASIEIWSCCNLIITILHGPRGNRTNDFFLFQAQQKSQCLMVKHGKTTIQTWAKSISFHHFWIFKPPTVPPFWSNPT